MSDEENLLFEAGVYYRFPKNEKEECPRGMIECRYERCHKGKSYGIGRVFILSRYPIDFYRLIDNWNRKGVTSHYSYHSFK